MVTKLDASGDDWRTSIMILRLQFYQWYELGGDSGYLGLLVVQVRKKAPLRKLLEKVVRLLPT